MNIIKRKLNTIRFCILGLSGLQNLLLFTATLAIFLIMFNFLFPLLVNDFNILKNTVFVIRGLSIAILIYFLIRIILSYRSLHYLADKIEKKFPQHNEVLLSSLELENETRYSADIIRANQKQAEKVANGLYFCKIIVESGSTVYKLIKILVE